MSLLLYLSTLLRAHALASFTRICIYLYECRIDLIVNHTYADFHVMPIIVIFATQILALIICDSVSLMP